LAASVCDENTAILCDITVLEQLDAIVLFKALEIKTKYQFSFLDSVIIATALHAGCADLYSEDFQPNQLIEGKLKIINPFA
jgi:predicted nucleic acid-binding protein